MFISIVVICAAIILFIYLIKVRPKKKYRINSMYTDALNAMLKADKPRAIALLRDVVKKDSNHIEAYIQLGNIIRDDNPQQALNDLITNIDSLALVSATYITLLSSEFS